MKTTEALTKCPCGAELHATLIVPHALSQKSQTIECKECASKFLATVHRKASAGKITFQIIDLSEKACEALRAKAAPSVASVP